jgi:hypothetical protein
MLEVPESHSLRPSMPGYFLPCGETERLNGTQELSAGPGDEAWQKAAH